MYECGYYIAGPIKCSWPSVTLWSVFANPVTYVKFNVHTITLHRDDVTYIVTTYTLDNGYITPTTTCTGLGSGVLILSDYVTSLTSALGEVMQAPQGKLH